MEECEKGRLYPIKADGSETAPFLINKRVLHIGSGDSCGIRIYTDGIYPEHCVLTTGKRGKVYLEPLHPTALALVNEEKITKKVLLKQDDVITVLAKSFRFAYPANSIQSQIYLKFPIVSSVAMKTTSPKWRISSGKKSTTPKWRNSSGKKSASPKEKFHPNVDDNLHIIPMKRPATGICAEQGMQKKKKLLISEKKVRFGPKLTPEEFDKHLPPSSPLRRGSLPGQTRSQSILKQRLSFQPSPDSLKRNKVSKAKSFSSGSKRTSFSPKSAKLSRGSPLVDKSLNIANESSTTFTVDVEIHSGPKSKIEASITSMPKKSSIGSEELGGNSPHSVPIDDITKISESRVSINTPPNFGKRSFDAMIDKKFSDKSCISVPLDDITKISQSPVLKKTALKSDKNITPDSSAIHERPLFSDILKKHKDNSGKISTESQAKTTKLKGSLKKASKYLLDHQKSSEKCIHQQILAVGSTGHANSPATIILSKRKIAELDDISDVVNVRRSPRTPRRAKYNTIIRKTSSEFEKLESKDCGEASLEKLPENVIKEDIKTTPIQPRNINKFDKEVFKKPDSQLKDTCCIKIGENPEGKVQFESCNDALVEQFLKEEEKQDIKATPNKQKKGRKSGEFIKNQDSDIDVLCNSETGENPEEKVQFESCNDAFVEQFLEEEEKQDIKATPNKQKKGRKSGEVFKNQDSDLDVLCNSETGETVKKGEIMQPESSAVSLSKTFEDDSVEQNVKVTPTHPNKGEESGIKIIEEQDSPFDDLYNKDKSGNSEGEIDSKLQPFSPKEDDKTVKEIKKTETKQPRKGRKLLQVSKENEVEKTEHLIKPENEIVKETKTMKRPKKGKKVLQVPQENMDTKRDDLITQSESSENTSDVKSPLIDSPSNEKENESLNFKEKKPVKRSRNKKVLIENEENQVNEDLSTSGPEKTVNLNPTDVSVQGITPETVKTNIKNVDKPPPKRRRVKKDCSAEKELKSSSKELSPCRRVTRSMAKKCAPK